MNQRHLAGIGARLVTFLEDLQAAAEDILTHLPEGDRPLADFNQFIRPVKALRLVSGSKAKNSARPIGMPSRMRFSAPTEGFEVLI